MRLSLISGRFFFLLFLHEAVSFAAEQEEQVPSLSTPLYVLMDKVGPVLHEWGPALRSLNLEVYSDSSVVWDAL